MCETWRMQAFRGVLSAGFADRVRTKEGLAIIGERCQVPQLGQERGAACPRRAGVRSCPPCPRVSEQPRPFCAWGKRLRMLGYPLLRTPEGTAGYWPTAFRKRLLVR